ncbi:hypothetical protein [Fibrobacter sp.]|uniref:hypothetical protein n=1 Tax=Fibrobacter sp. TaxID=35828 RepID=UPI00388E56D9
MDKKETKIVPFEQLSITNKFMFSMVFSHKEIAKRARFYQAMRDCETLSKGEKYRDLRELYIIFLCPACAGMTLGRSVDDNGAATLCLEPRAPRLTPVVLSAL